jgi:hypothetical protein
MSTPSNTTSTTTQAQARRDEAMRIAYERRAALEAQMQDIISAEIHYTSDPGPDYAPGAWS